jgi:hypothetical protein
METTDPDGVQMSSRNLKNYADSVAFVQANSTRPEISQCVPRNGLWIHPSKSLSWLLPNGPPHPLLLE